jgi:RNA polymerase sigma factor (sigma-70 family)
MALAHQNIEDSSLLQNYYADKNNYWLGILLQRYTGLLFGVCMKYLKNENDAQDAVQQVFLKVINDIGKYKVDYFKSWLYMVAKNHCLMQLRGNKHNTTALVSDVAELNGNPALEKKQQQQAATETLQTLEEAIAQLNVEQRECVQLFYLEKYSYQQIAEKTTFSVLQVKSYLQNGKRNLKIIMEKAGYNHAANDE